MCWCWDKGLWSRHRHHGLGSCLRPWNWLQWVGSRIMHGGRPWGLDWADVLDDGVEDAGDGDAILLDDLSAEGEGVSCRG